MQSIQVYTRYVLDDVDYILFFKIDPSLLNDKNKAVECFNEVEKRIKPRLIKRLVMIAFNDCGWLNAYIIFRLSCYRVKRFLVYREQSNELLSFSDKSPSIDSLNEEDIYRLLPSACLPFYKISGRIITTIGGLKRSLVDEKTLEWLDKWLESESDSVHYGPLSLEDKLISQIQLDLRLTLNIIEDMDNAMRHLPLLLDNPPTELYNFVTKYTGLQESSPQFGKAVLLTQLLFVKDI